MVSSFAIASEYPPTPKCDQDVGDQGKVKLPKDYKADALEVVPMAYDTMAIVHHTQVATRRGVTTSKPTARAGSPSLGRPRAP